MTSIGGEAFLNQRLSSAPAQIACELDVNVTAPASTTGETDIFKFVTHLVPSSEHELYIAYFDRWVIAEYALSKSVNRMTAIEGGLPSGVWTHLVFTMDGSSLVLSVDGKVSATLTALTPVTPSYTEIQAGLSYVQSTGSASLSIDNLRCKWSPP